MFDTGETVGLAEWIIDDTCLVLKLFFPDFAMQFVFLERNLISYFLFLGVQHDHVDYFLTDFNRASIQRNEIQRIFTCHIKINSNNKKFCWISFVFL